MKLIDISPPITPALGVWPGDTAPRREVLLEIARGDTVTLSTLHATVHLGAHADGPNHYAAGGAGIEHFSLERYVGPCQVVRVNVGRGARVRVGDFGTPPHCERVLIATGTFPHPEIWNNDFAALAPELVDWLGAKGVKLVGIDTPSVDLMDDKELSAHQRFAAHDMAILEGLVLKDVAAGDYELLALPLPLVGFDASPVRAVLRAI